LWPYNNYNNLLCKLASNNYQIFTTALTITVAEGCFLLLLNILIFAGIYHQRDREGSGGHFGDKKKEKLTEADSCSSNSRDGHHFESKNVLVGHVVLLASQQHLHPSASAAAIELPLQ
jgi:neuroligin